MTLFIHHDSDSYSHRWIDYCNRKQIPYKIINCRDTDIIPQLKTCKGLLWHWDLNDYRIKLFSRQLTASLIKKGIKVYPDLNSAWHYDDKIGQKYLLEAVNAPLVNSYVFYSKPDALLWIEKTDFPKVFKLKCGAGSRNVRLVRNKRQANKLVRKSFGKGFNPVAPLARIKDRFWILRRDRNWNAIKKVAGGIARLIIPKEKEKLATKEKGYIYFQDFIPKNTYDTRLVVIGNRCFALRRYCRKGDFRASGSGLLDYNPEITDIRMVKIAHETAKALNTQTLALDFILDNNVPKIIEISYCHPIDFLDPCPGYWDSDLKWHEGKFIAQELIIDDFLASLTTEEKKKRKKEEVTEFEYK